MACKASIYQAEGNLEQAGKLFTDKRGDSTGYALRIKSLS